jgi:hypothetical protein
LDREELGHAAREIAAFNPMCCRRSQAARPQLCGE